MNRAIKFRAWDGITMTTGFALEAHTGSPFQFMATIPERTEDRDWPLMQFTGLLDKNGKEIYEGDVIRVLSDSGMQNGHYDTLTEVVKWVEPSNWMGSCNVVGFVNHAAIYDAPVEVIGNIYENPELLTV